MKETWTPIDKLRDGILANRKQVNMLNLLRDVEIDHRAAMLRLVVAQQWERACTAMLAWGHLAYVASPTASPASDDSHRSLHWSLVGGEVPVEVFEAGLPCAVDVVADLLGGGA